MEAVVATQEPKTDIGQQNKTISASAQYPAICPSGEAFVDNRKDTARYLMLQRMVDSSPRLENQSDFLKMSDNDRSAQPANGESLSANRIGAKSPALQRIKWETVRDKPWRVFSDSYEIAYGVRWSKFLVDTDAGNPITVLKPDDGTTFFCHGFTFGGYRVEGGPYSMDGTYVPRVLSDEYTQVEVPQIGNVVAFYDREGVSHTGIVQSINTGQSDPRDAVSIISKLGSKSLSTLTLRELLGKYPGEVKYYSKTGGGGEEWLEEMMPVAPRGRSIEGRHRAIKELERGISEVNFLFRLYAKLLAGVKPSTEEMERYYEIKRGMQ